MSASAVRLPSWLLVAGLAACGAAASHLPKATPAAPLTSVPPELLMHGGLLLLGEVHGTREIPRRVGEIVALVSADRPVVLALEMPPGRTPSLRQFLDGPGGDAALRQLVSDPWWHDPFQDGRRSAAMVDLLDQLRRLRAAGRTVAVVPIDTDDVTASAEDRESTLTANVLAAIRTHPGATMIVYAGNLHTGRSPGRFRPAFEWMAMRLARARVPFVSLNASWQDGTTWSCRASVIDQCRVWFLPASGTPGPAKDRPALDEARALRASGSTDRELPSDGAAPQPTTRPAPDRAGPFSLIATEEFDGTYDVGPLTASPPAIARYGGAPGDGAAIEQRLAETHDEVMTSPAAWRARAHRAYRARDFELCVSYLSQIAMPPANDAYDRACCLSLAGRPSEANAALRYALSRGFSNRVLAEADRDLDAARAHPSWPFNPPPPPPPPRFRN